MSDDDILVENLWETERGAEFLEHFGIKGMRWGVRRETSNGDETPSIGSHLKFRRKPQTIHDSDASSDFQKAKEAKLKMKEKGASSLSNKEMQDLVNRMNLEKQLSTLTAKDKSQYRSMVEKNLTQAMSKGMKQALDYGVKFAFQKFVVSRIEMNQRQRQLSLWGGK